jgi:hypothetical protein
VLVEATGTHPTYEIKGTEHYVRASVIDSNRAWTHPVFLDGRRTALWLRSSEPCKARLTCSVWTLLARLAARVAHHSSQRVGSVSTVRVPTVSLKVFRPHGVYQEIPGDRFFRKRSGRSKWGTRRLREFCGSQSCFVVLFHALGSICNGHPASKVIKNQVVTNCKKSIFNATAIS